MRTTRQEFITEALGYIHEELDKSPIKRSTVLSKILEYILEVILDKLVNTCLLSILVSIRNPNRVQQLLLRVMLHNQLWHFQLATPEIDAQLKSKFVEDAMMTGLLRLGQTVQQEELQTVFGVRGDNVTG